MDNSPNDSIAKFLNNFGSGIPVDVAMNHIDRMEAESWKIAYTSTTMTFTSPPITFSEGDISVTSRYEFKFQPKSRDVPLKITMLDILPHWLHPYHPHAYCWGREGNRSTAGSYVHETRDPFTIVETIAAVYSGITKGYDITPWSPEPLPECAYCECRIRKSHETVTQKRNGREILLHIRCDLPWRLELDL